MKRIVLLFVILMVSLSSCAPAASTPTATLPAPSATPVPLTATALPPTVTPLPPTATPKPTATPLPLLPVRFDQPLEQPSQALSASNATGLLELARWGAGRAETISWSPDDAWLVVHTPLGAYLYDAAKPTSAFYLEGVVSFSPDGTLLAAAQAAGSAPRTSVYALNGISAAPRLLYALDAGRPVFSPDGSRLAMAAVETVQVVEAKTGKPLGALDHKNVEQLTFSMDGALLLSGARDSLVVWQAADGAQLKRMDYNRLVRLVFSADGSLLLVQNRTRQNEPVVDIWSVKEWKLLSTIKTAGTFSLSPDASRMVVFTNFPTPGKIEVFQLPDGKALPGLRMTGSIHRITVSPDGKTLAVSVPDPELGVVHLVDSAANKIRLTLNCEHSCDAQLPYYSPDGRLLALYGHMPMTGGDVGVVVLYDAATGKTLRRLLAPRAVKSVVERIIFSKDSARIALLTGRSDDAVRIWEAGSGKLLHTLEWAPQTYNLGALSPDGKLVAVYSDNPTTRLLQTRDGKMIRQIEKVALPQFSADGSLLAGVEFANYRPDAIRLWKVPGGEVAATFGKQLRPPLVLSPGGEMGAVLSGFSVQLLRIPSGQFITALSASAYPNVRLLVTGFSPDGKMVAAGDESGLVWNWQVENRKLLFVMEGHKKEISALAFSADNQTLVSLSQDGGVRLWKAADGKLVRAVNAAELIVKQPGMEETTFGLATGVALSPDGRLLAVGGFLNPQQAPPGKAGVTLLVDAETGQLVRLLRGGGGMVFFSPDGKLLYTSGDGAVRVWGVLP